MCAHLCACGCVCVCACVCVWGGGGVVGVSAYLSHLHRIESKGSKLFLSENKKRNILRGKKVSHLVIKLQLIKGFLDINE